MRHVVLILASVLTAGCNAILGQRAGIADEAGSDATPSGCSTCALDHATAACVDGACAITTCDDGWEDVDRDPSNGCEVANPTTVDALAVWFRADKGVTTSDGGVVSWDSQGPKGGTATVTSGAPTLDTSSWPDAGLPSVSFMGNETMGVDLSSMMNKSGYTAFLALARYGDVPTNCALGSPYYPSGVCGGNPNASGEAFQLGWLSNTKTFFEPLCSSMAISCPANGPKSYQPFVFTMWFDPINAPEHFYSLDDQQTSTAAWAHALWNLTAPSILGGCPSGPRYLGLVGELIVYEALLTNEDRQRVQAYLKARWKTR